MVHTCVVQATQLPARTEQAGALVTALMTVAGRMRKIGDTGPAEKAALVVLHHVSSATGPTRISDLATGMHLDSSTVSRHVAALERSGHLQRAIDPDDHRASRIALTEIGREALAAAFRTWRDTLDAALTDWSAADRATLTTLLTRLATDLEATTPDEKDS